jgi:hypothetical protein
MREVIVATRDREIPATTNNIAAKRALPSTSENPGKTSIGTLIAMFVTRLKC